MKKIAIMTDSNSGIMAAQAKEVGVAVLAMPFTIDGTTYREGVDLDREVFFNKQVEGASISTSMPPAGEVIEMWDELLKDHDEVVYIPMSSGLSSSCEMAQAMAADYEGRVFVVNNQRVSVPQRCTVEDAIQLKLLGMDGAKIKEILEREKFNSDTYIMVEDLKYLKKGGRITPTVAAMGMVLRIKPVLQMHGEKIDIYSKMRSQAKARLSIIEALKESMERMQCNNPEEMRLQAAYTCDEATAADWIAQLEESFPGFKVDAEVLPLSTACHLGPGVIAAAVSKRVPELVEAKEELINRL